MAFSAAPQDHISGISEDGTDLTIPLASIPGLTAVEADATSGDIRKLAQGLAEMLYQVFNDMATADRPGKWTSLKQSKPNNASGVQQDTYSNIFQVDQVDLDVSDE